MTKDSSQEAVDRAVRDLHAFLEKSQHLEVPSVRAIADQFRAEAALARSMRHHRHVFDAVAEYFAHAADARDKAEPGHHHGIGDAVRALVENLDDNDED